MLTLLALLACSGSDKDDVQPTDTEPTTDDSNPDDTDSAVPNDCPQVCGADLPITAAGAASGSPGGCDGGDFQSFGWSAVGADGAAEAAVVLGDVNGDGHIDSVINAREAESVMLGLGDGGSSLFATTPLPGVAPPVGGWGADIGDFDGDGSADIVAGDATQGGLAWLGSTQTPASLGLPQDAMAGAGLGDIDGDGDLDLILGADSYNRGFAVYSWTAGTWSPVTVTGLPGLGEGDASNVGALHFHDIDDDGDLDLIAFGQVSSDATAWIYANGGDGSSWSLVQALEWSSTTGGVPVQGSVGDVDCDGDLDIALGGAIFRNEASTFTRGASPNGATVSHMGDMNGDGFLDLVTHDDTEGLRLYLNEGDGLTFTALDVGFGGQSWVAEGTTGALKSAYGFDLADIDGDNDLDIVRVVRARDGEGIDAEEFNVQEVWIRQ